MIHSKWSSNQSSVVYSIILSSFQMIVIQNNNIRKHFYKNEKKKISNCSFNHEIIYSWVLEDFKISNFAVVYSLLQPGWEWWMCHPQFQLIARVQRWRHWAAGKRPCGSQSPGLYFPWWDNELWKTGGTKTQNCCFKWMSFILTEVKIHNSYSNEN